MLGQGKDVRDSATLKDNLIIKTQMKMLMSKWNIGVLQEYEDNIEKISVKVSNLSNCTDAVQISLSTTAVLCTERKVV